MSNLLFTRDLTPADDVSDAMWSFTFTTADGKNNVVVGLTVSITSVVEGPPLVSGWPAAVTIPDTAKAGSILASGSVTNSDGSPFTGTLSSAVDAAGNPLAVSFQP